MHNANNLLLLKKIANITGFLFTTFVCSIHTFIVLRSNQRNLFSIHKQYRQYLDDDCERSLSFAAKAIEEVMFVQYLSLSHGLRMINKKFFGNIEACENFLPIFHASKKSSRESSGKFEFSFHA